jgi:hypothetical protein
MYVMIIGVLVALGIFLMVSRKDVSSSSIDSSSSLEVNKKGEQSVTKVFTETNNSTVSNNEVYL